jgi:tetratricopeptide (TPR) repeat protein
METIHMLRRLCGFATLMIFASQSAAAVDDWQDCKMGSPDHRIAACTQIINKGGESLENLALAYHTRGYVYATKGEHDRAIADYSEAIQLDPKSALTYINRGAAYADKGEHDRAIADYSEAIRLDPSFARAYHNRGYAYNVKREPDRGIADFNEAIRLNPKDASAYTHRGYAYGMKGNTNRAIAEYSEAIRLAPQYALAYIHRGRAYAAKADNDRAIADFNEAIRFEPTNALVYVNRALAYAGRGDIERAIADYRRVLELPAPSATDRQRQEIARERIARLAHPQATPLPSTPGRRVALVIGNSNYAHAGVLANPEHDARATAAALRRLGFAEVIERYDLSREMMGKVLKAFGDRAEGAEWAVVFFAGHGLEMNGITYLIPTDAELKRDTHVRDETVSLTQVQAKVDVAAKLGLVMLDSCRNNPFSERMVRTGGAIRSIGQGLAKVEPEGNVLVAYAAKHGTTAEDGVGENSPFTAALLANIEEPGLEINFLFRKVRDEVRAKTQRRQEPFLYGSLSSELLYFKAASAR